MPYREELDAALARAAATEAELDEARAENAHDHERIGDLEAKLAEAQKRLAKIEASAPAPEPKPAPKVEAPKKPATRSERARHAVLERLDAANTALEKHKSEPTSLFGNMVRSTSAWILMPALCATIFFHIWGFPALGASPASLACPLQCTGCHPSARIFSWNYRGSSRSEKGRQGYALVCRNDAVDVTTLTSSEVSGAKNRKLQPYMINGIVVFFLEAAALFPFVFLVCGAIYGPRRRRRILEERKKLEDAVARAEAIGAKKG